MQRLVSPELKIYTISDREALSELVTELRHLESGKLVPVVGSLTHK